MAEEENNNSNSNIESNASSGSGSNSNNLPGIVKKQQYTHKAVKKINPTKQKVLEELPSAPKYEFKPEDYTLHTGTPNWLPQEGIKIEEVASALSSTSTPSETSTETPKEIKQQPPKVKEVVKEKESKFKKIEPKKQSQPSDMDLAMMQAELEKAKQKQAEQEKLRPIEVPADYKPTKAKTPENNMFEKINAMAAQMPAQEVEEKSEVKDAKLLMKIDKTEVQVGKSESGETIYIVDKEPCTVSEYREFMQQVAGKILALDCKKLEVDGIVYSKRKDGYVGSDGKEMSVDDMLKLVSSK